MLTLEFTFYNAEFRLELETLVWMLFRDVGLKECPHDPNWKNLTKMKPTFGQTFDERSQQDRM